MPEYARGGLIKPPEDVDRSAAIVPVRDCGYVLWPADLEALGRPVLAKVREWLATCGDACGPPPR